MITTTRLPAVFNTLGDENRLSILKLLLEKSSDEIDICVSEIADKINTSIPMASRHLKMMESSGLVKRKRVGQMICYEIDHKEPIMKEIVRILKKVEK